MELKRKTTVRMHTDETKHVKEMSDIELIDAFNYHTDFALGALDLITDAFHSPSGGNPDSIRSVASEVTTRMNYIDIMGDELHRRLTEARKEKAA